MRDGVQKSENVDRDRPRVSVGSRPRPIFFPLSSLYSSERERHTECRRSTERSDREARVQSTTWRIRRRRRVRCVTRRETRARDVGSGGTRTKERRVDAFARSATGRGPREARRPSAPGRVISILFLSSIRGVVSRKGAFIWDGVCPSASLK